MGRRRANETGEVDGLYKKTMKKKNTIITEKEA